MTSPMASAVEQEKDRAREVSAPARGLSTTSDEENVAAVGVDLAIATGCRSFEAAIEAAIVRFR